MRADNRETLVLESQVSGTRYPVVSRTLHRRHCHEIGCNGVFGRGIQFVAADQYVYLNGGMESFFICVHVADTNKNSNSKALFIHALKIECVHQDLADL